MLQTYLNQTENKSFSPETVSAGILFNVLFRCGSKLFGTSTKYQKNFFFWRGELVYCFAVIENERGLIAHLDPTGCMSLVLVGKLASKDPWPQSNLHMLMCEDQKIQFIKLSLQTHSLSPIYVHK